MMFLKAKHKILQGRKYVWLFYYVYFRLEIWLDFLNLHSLSFCQICPGQLAVVCMSMLNTMQIRCNSQPQKLDFNGNVCRKMRRLVLFLTVGLD